MKSGKDQKTKVLESLAESLGDDFSGVTVAVQQLHEAFDSFNQPGQHSFAMRMRVSECIYEVWVQATQTFVRSI